MENQGPIRPDDPKKIGSGSCNCVGGTDEAHTRFIIWIDENDEKNAENQGKWGQFNSDKLLEIKVLGPIQQRKMLKTKVIGANSTGLKMLKNQGNWDQFNREENV
jgi:hypothetical protein